MEGVGAEFEEAAEVARGGGGPEGEFLHEGGFFVGDEGFEFAVEGGEVGVVLDGVEGGVVAVVSLVFPYVDCHRSLISDDWSRNGGRRKKGKGIPNVSQSPTSVLQLPTRFT